MAASIQAEIETIVNLIHQKRDLETEIREAVKQRDWAKASEVQAKIDSLESGKSIDSKSISKTKINSKVTVSLF